MFLAQVVKRGQYCSAQSGHRTLASAVPETMAIMLAIAIARSESPPDKGRTTPRMIATSDESGTKNEDVTGPEQRVGQQRAIVAWRP